MLASATSFSDGSLAFVGRCELTRRNVFSAETVNKLFFSHSKVAWTTGELTSLRSEISMFKTLVERKFCATLLTWTSESNAPSSDPCCGGSREGTKLVDYKCGAV